MGLEPESKDCNLFRAVVSNPNSQTFTITDFLQESFLET